MNKAIKSLNPRSNRGRGFQANNQWKRTLKSQGKTIICLKI